MCLFFLARGTEFAAKLVEQAARIGLDLSFLQLKNSVDNIEENLGLGALDALGQQIGGPMQSPETTSISYHPDRTTSDIQRGSSGKKGYCYIGKDKGFRSCIYAGVNDVCESGELYPTMDVCRYPTKVRA